MKTTILLLITACLCFLFAACATPAETTAAVTAVGASVAGIIDAIGPLLPPETLAKLQTTATSIDGTVHATQSAIGVIADVITQMKTSVGTQLAERLHDVQRLTTQIENAPTHAEVYLTSAGSGAAGTGVSRLLSHFKHGARPSSVTA